ncbi:hypothetical protein Xcel_1030 [Xylanimonas cellulosilytica DSM 15894]|uniref:Uncharacterized protein n=1 Tax=Xylanimonas cellulosilytica (strain DSM 15894 / JCM 12276 / CECT 5975 / KCTC 9989 / LMG 20990 / NBRC 107835 / XIL07) TaxID=446471 RepID=D1BYY6_XYLCX|nr:hypothetical protein [Xylanimonas cellulosilytica]ACZ30061.1 hypothetical protein Xcel_1030 [Xylanimonas cellulosilytica DSM 15894]
MSDLATPQAPDDLVERPDALDPERGDVPGWVLVTLMTAGLVVALWAIAGPLLEQAFQQAISSVTGL